jgi:hypothetical protein
MLAAVRRLYTCTHTACMGLFIQRFPNLLLCVCVRCGCHTDWQHSPAAPKAEACEWRGRGCGARRRAQCANLWWCGRRRRR